MKLDLQDVTLKKVVDWLKAGSEEWKQVGNQFGARNSGSQVCELAHGFSKLYGDIADAIEIAVHKELEPISRELDSRYVCPRAFPDADLRREIMSGFEENQRDGVIIHEEMDRCDSCVNESCLTVKLRNIVDKFY